MDFRIATDDTNATLKGVDKSTPLEAFITQAIDAVSQTNEWDGGIKPTPMEVALYVHCAQQPRLVTGLATQPLQELPIPHRTKLHLQQVKRGHGSIHVATHRPGEKRHRAESTEPTTAHQEEPCSKGTPEASITSPTITATSTGKRFHVQTASQMKMVTSGGAPASSTTVVPTATFEATATPMRCTASPSPRFRAPTTSSKMKMVSSGQTTTFPSTAAQPDGWNCSTCTFENKAFFPSCEMCGARRDSEALTDDIMKQQELRFTQAQSMGRGVGRPYGGSIAHGPGGYSGGFASHDSTFFGAHDSTFFGAPDDLSAPHSGSSRHMPQPYSSVDRPSRHADAWMPRFNAKGTRGTQSHRLINGAKEAIRKSMGLVTPTGAPFEVVAAREHAGTSSLFEAVSILIFGTAKKENMDTVRSVAEQSLSTTPNSQTKESLFEVLRRICNLDVVLVDRQTHVLSEGPQKGKKSDYCIYIVQDGDMYSAVRAVTFRATRDVFLRADQVAEHAVRSISK